MEGMGLPERRVPSNRPIAVAYEIIDFGRLAMDVLDELTIWSEERDI